MYRFVDLFAYYDVHVYIVLNDKCFWNYWFWQISSEMFFCTTCSQALCLSCRTETHKAKMFASHDVINLSNRTKEIQRECCEDNINASISQKFLCYTLSKDFSITWVEFSLISFKVLIEIQCLGWMIGLDILLCMWHLKLLMIRTWTFFWFLKEASLYSINFMEWMTVVLFFSDPQRALHFVLHWEKINAVHQLF